MHSCIVKPPGLAVSDRTMYRNAGSFSIISVYPKGLEMVANIPKRATVLNATFGEGIYVLPANAKKTVLECVKEYLDPLVSSMSTLGGSLSSNMRGLGHRLI